MTGIQLEKKTPKGIIQFLNTVEEACEVYLQHLREQESIHKQQFVSLTYLSSKQKE